MHAAVAVDSKPCARVGRDILARWGDHQRCILHCRYVSFQLIWTTIIHPSLTSTLPRKGTAVDAAIAALFCNGVSNPHSMGLGGGFLMTVYLANGTAVRSSLCREKTLNYVYMMTS